MVELFLVLCVLTVPTSSPDCRRVPTPILYNSMEECQTKAGDHGRVSLQMAATQAMEQGYMPVQSGIACRLKPKEIKADEQGKLDGA